MSIKPGEIMKISGWMITQDHITPDPLDEFCRTGKQSHDWTPACMTHAIEFKTYDDDGILYHQGYLVDDDYADNQMRVLDWAMYDAGAVTIKVRRCHKWVVEIG